MKKKSLLEPTRLEASIQGEISAVISNTPDPSELEHLMPKIKEMGKKVKPKNVKEYIRRLWNE